MPHLEFAERGYILLSGIELPDIPNAITADGHNLVRKSEFHMTLIGAAAVKLITGEEVVSPEIKDIVTDFAEDHDIASFTPLHDYRLVQRDERVTVIRMVKTNYIDDLYDRLNTSFGTTVPVQPTHITLYSRDPLVGISVNSWDQLIENTRSIDL